VVLNPDTYDKLDALWRRFDHFPEAKLVAAGALINTDAYLAFLEARRLIEKVRIDLANATRHWHPIETFFSEAPEMPMVLLWGMNPEYGQVTVMLGYWDEDLEAWYREGQGNGDPVIEPTKWMRLGDLSLPDDEFVAPPPHGGVRPIYAIGF
jgi:hypothetical protein